VDRLRVRFSASSWIALSAAERAVAITQADFACVVLMVDSAVLTEEVRCAESNEGGDPAD
jgi:hypothetical protein